MTSQQITALAFKIFSIWLLVQLILNLSPLIMYISGIESYLDHNFPVSFYISTLLAFLIVGLIAVFLLHRLARSVLNSTDTEKTYDISKDAQKYFLQVVGVYFIVISLAYLPRSISAVFLSDQFFTDSLFWPGGLIFQFIVGITLVGQSIFWSNLLKKMRG